MQIAYNDRINRHVMDAMQEAYAKHGPKGKQGPRGLTEDDKKAGVVGWQWDSETDTNTPIYEDDWDLGERDPSVEEACSTECDACQ